MLEMIWHHLPKRAIAGVVATILAVAGYQAFFDQGIDTQGRVTVDEARALALGKDGIAGTEDDIKHAIVGLTYWSPCSQPAKVNPNAEFTLRSFQEAGIRTYGYALVDSHRSGPEAMKFARTAVKDQAVWDKVEWIGVDFEIPTECYNAGTRVPYSTIVGATDYLREIGKCVQWADGCRSVLYTSCGEWTSRLPPGNLPKPPMTLLWNASWDNNPDIDYMRCQFGGYTPDEVLVEQWSGGTYIAGVNVDQNTVVIPPPPVITPPPCESCSHLATPPDMSAQCWTDAWDPFWSARYNWCADAWVGIGASGTYEFLNLRTGTWHYMNGVPK